MTSYNFMTIYDPHPYSYPKILDPLICDVIFEDPIVILGWVWLKYFKSLIFKFSTYAHLAQLYVHIFSPLGPTFYKCDFTHSFYFIYANSFSLCYQGFFLSPFLMLRLTLFVNILFSYKYVVLAILYSVIKLT